MASEAELKDRMVRTIVGELKIPVELQFALSQRLYFEALQAGGLFWARNDPDGAVDRAGRRAAALSGALGGLGRAGEPAGGLSDGRRGQRQEAPAERRLPLAAGAAEGSGAIGGRAEAADHRHRL
jgi:hypothetical protein